MKANSKYLTLALDVRKITDSLIRLAEGGPIAESLNTSLPKMLASLDAKGDRTTVQRLRASGTFGLFENQQTLNEVFEKPQVRENLIDKIQIVLNSPSPEEKRTGALAAIPLLDALERRALYRYNRPQIPPKLAAR